MIRDLDVAQVDVVEDLVDVVAHVALAAEPRDVAVGRVLRLRRRFPLVAPDDSPPGPLEPDAETADAGEEFDDPRTAVRVGQRYAERSFQCRLRGVLLAG